MANSRDFVRRDTLLAPRLSCICRIRMRGTKLARQLRHFDGREPRFESLVPTFESRAGNGLIERIAREHTEDDRQVAVHLRRLQSACCFRTNVIIVRRFATQHASDLYQRIVLTLRRMLVSRQLQYSLSRSNYTSNLAT